MRKEIRENKYFRWGLTAFVVIVCALVCNQVLKKWDSIAEVASIVVGALRPIIIGLIIAYVLNPLLKFYEKYAFSKLFSAMFKKKPVVARRITRWVGILFTLITAFAVVAGLVVLIAPELYVNTTRLVTNLPLYIENTISYLTELSKTYPEVVTPIAEYLQAVFQDLLTWLKEGLLPNANRFITNLSMGIYGTVSAVFDIIVGVIVAIYVLASKCKYAAGARKLVYSIFKKENAEKVIALVKYTDAHFGGFLGGKVVDSAIIGILSFIVFSIFNIPYSLLVSVIVGVTNIIPFFGPFLGAIPSAVLILLVDPLKALIFVVLIVAIQQLDGNIIGPKILGNKTGLDSFAIIFSILVFGGLFGVVGMIIGVPVFATVFGIVKSVCDQNLEKKNLPTELDAYTHGKVVKEIVKNIPPEE